MLLHLAGTSPSIVDKVIYDAAGTELFTFNTRCVWKSDSPNVPDFRQTEIKDSNTGQVLAQLDWDGGRPVYVDLGQGDERLVAEMAMPKAILPGKLIFETPVDLRWELTPKGMILQEGIHTMPLARYHPHSRVTTDGRIEHVPGTKSKIAKDWLEINMIEQHIPIVELLVDFIILEHFRRLYFVIDETPSRTTPAVSESLQKRIRQAVF